MRSTLILVKREIEDYAAIPFVVAVIVGCGAAILSYSEYGPLDPRSSHAIPENVLAILLSVVAGLALLAVIMGAIQMAGDRMAGISSFLATLAPTRAQLFRAKYLVGLLWIVLTLFPIFSVHIYTLMERDLEGTAIGSLLLGSVLFLSASYGLGLRIGLMRCKSIALIVAVTVLMGLFMLLVLMGLDWDCFLLLGLLSLLLVWGAGARFKTLSL